MRINKLPLSLGLMILVSLPGFGQISTKAEKDLAAAIDALVLSIPTPFNGNVLVAVNDHVILQKSYGYANFETKAKLDEASLFELASVTKQFTAMGIMILEERGKLSYQDDLRKFFPELPYQGVTIYHLLTHTSGIPDYNDEFATRFPAKKVLHNDDVVRMLIDQKPAVHFKPGEQFEYSNTGYVLLASIIGKVAGMSYRDFLAANIFKPCQMTRSRVYNTRRLEKEVIPDYALGYVYSGSEGKFVLPDEDPNVRDYVYAMDGIVGDGGVSSTTTDLFKWSQALTNHTLVKAEEMKKAWTPVKLADGKEGVAGFGWFIETKPAVGKIIYHGGGHPGYGTLILRFEDLHAVVIVLSNNSGRGMKNFIPDVIKLFGTAKS